MLQLPQVDARDGQSASSVRQLVDENGVVILRNVFDRADVAELLERLDEFRADVIRSMETGEEPSFPDYCYYNNKTKSCELLGLDPGSRVFLQRQQDGGEGLDYPGLIRHMSLLNTIKAARSWPDIEAVIGEGAIIQGCRARVVHHEAGQPGSDKGGVALHQEKWPIRDQDVPVGHNIWMLLNSDGGVANGTLPGLQFVLGNIDFWRQDIPDTEEEYAESFRKKILRLNGLCRRAADSPDETVEVDGHVIFRPKMRLGDLALFDHHIPHGSFVPGGASGVRISCEFRIFPPDRRYTGLKY